MEVNYTTFIYLLLGFLIVVLSCCYIIHLPSMQTVTIYRIVKNTGQNPPDNLYVLEGAFKWNFYMLFFKSCKPVEECSSLLEIACENRSNGITYLLGKDYGEHNVVCYRYYHNLFSKASIMKFFVLDKLDFADEKEFVRVFFSYLADK